MDLLRRRTIESFNYLQSCRLTHTAMIKTANKHRLRQQQLLVTYNIEIRG
jgi:hypothetical protein